MTDQQRDKALLILLNAQAIQMDISDALLKKLPEMETWCRLLQHMTKGIDIFIDEVIEEERNKNEHD